MSISVTTAAATTDLTTLGAFKGMMGSVIPDGAETLIGELIQRASDAIVRVCHRPFAREAVTETLPGDGGISLMLTRTPVLSVSLVTLLGETVVDYSIEDSGAGILYRQNGWTWTVGAGWELTEVLRVYEMHPSYSVSYIGGYLMPSDDIVGGANISVSGVDNSFNDSASGFPLLIPGDTIRTSGFTNSGNNGRFTVVSRTAAKIVVSGTLTTEAGSAETIKNIAVRTLPHDIEMACLETIKIWYLNRATDPSVLSKSVGDLKVTYGYGWVEGDVGRGGIPLAGMRLLKPWIRAA